MTPALATRYDAKEGAIPGPWPALLGLVTYRLALRDPEVRLSSGSPCRSRAN